MTDASKRNIKSFQQRPCDHSRRIDGMCPYCGDEVEAMVTDHHISDEAMTSLQARVAGTGGAMTMDRCESVHGSLRCVGTSECVGPHWAPTGGNNGVRWGLSDNGCIVGMDVGLVCRKGRNHDGHHNDGKGTTWGDHG